MVPSDFKVDTSFGLLVLHWSSLEIAHVSSLLCITVLGGNKCFGLDSSETLLVLTCFFSDHKDKEISMSASRPTIRCCSQTNAYFPSIKYFKAIVLAKRTAFLPP